MPELPEVETVVRDLRPALMGKILTGMIIKPKCLTNMLKVRPEFFYENTIGQRVVTVVRKGKYIIVPLSNNAVIVMHLGMTGKLLLLPLTDASFEDRLADEAASQKHTHFLLEFVDEDGEDNGVELHFNDVRTFGNIWVVTEVDDLERIDVPGLRELGPDALGITLNEFTSISDGKRNIKTSLMDQKKIAGVGNIYADEALFYAGVHPLREGRSLSDEQRARLWFSVKSVLKQGIRFRGSSVSDYTDASGSEGSFQNYHRVYGKAGQNCTDCGTPISRIKVGGRSTHFCPSCQPA